MNSELLHKLAVILLIIGILLLIVAIFCSVRFELISLIRTERNRRKAVKQGEEQEYFAPTHAKEIESISDDEPHSPAEKTIPTEKKQFEAETPTAASVHPEPVYSSAPQEQRTETLLVETGKRQQARNGTGTLLVSSRRVHSEAANSEPQFVITENIVVLGGDPAAVSQCIVSQRKGMPNE